MVGIVLATHGRIASAMAEAAEVVLGPQEALATVDLRPDQGGDEAWEQLRRAAAQVQRGQGVLVLVDMLGGTPSNLAMALLAPGQVEVLTGLSLPMVLRAAKARRELSLEALAQDVLAYGQRNITLASAWLKPQAPEGP